MLSVENGHGHSVSCRIKIWEAPSSMTGQWTGAYRLSKALRGHRRINLHWVKDVILNEDNCHITKPEQVATLGILRDIGFNFFIMEGFNSICNGRNGRKNR